MHPVICIHLHGVKFTGVCGISPNINKVFVRFISDFSNLSVSNLLFLVQSASFNKTWSDLRLHQE